MLKVGKHHFADRHCHLCQPPNEQQRVERSVPQVLRARDTLHLFKRGILWSHMQVYEFESRVTVLEADLGALRQQLEEKQP